MSSRAAIAIIVLTALAVILPPVPPTRAADQARWYSIALPAEGEAGGWALTDGEVWHLAIADDGTLYAIGSGGGAERLFRSRNGAATWTALGAIDSATVGIAVSPAGAVYYATASTVYASADGGETFTPLPANPGGAGGSGIAITSLDVTASAGGDLIAVGTGDSDAAEYGGVYTIHRDDPASGWTDSGIGGLDIVRVAFSPRYAEDGQVLAVGTDETDGLVVSRLGDHAWSADTAAAVLPGVVPRAATLAFPDGYSAAADGAIFFVGIDAGASGGGDVYSIARQGDALAASDRDAGVVDGLPDLDVSGLAVSGSPAAGMILAGAASGAQVRRSTDGGQTWTPAAKPPTGEGGTQVAMAPDFEIGGRAFAATRGAGAALSRTADGGRAWDQVSLVNTSIQAIVDLAVTPDCRRPAGLFLLTFGDGGHSLWRGTDDGAPWVRVLSSSLEGVDALHKVTMSPEYGAGGQVLFVYGESNGSPAIWRSTDGGATFEVAASPVAVDVWAAAGDDTLFIGGFDGARSVVYRYTGAAFTPDGGAPVGERPLYSIALSPSFQQDGTMLLGDTDGQAYWSADGGKTFQALGQQLQSDPAYGGSVSLAFGPPSSGGPTVYAATSFMSPEEGPSSIYRLRIGSEDIWQPIAQGVGRTNNGMSELAIADSGALYSLRSGNIADTFLRTGGMERALNPGHPLAQAIEPVPDGLREDAKLRGLRTCGNRVWAIDDEHVQLVAYDDTLATPVILARPEHRQPGVDPSKVTLDWALLPGATKYEWQIDDDNSFDRVPEGYEGETGASQVRLPELRPATAYYWRVRAVSPVPSPWSRKQSFTTALGDPGGALDLLSPEAGASGVPLKPVFQWSAVAGADRYELAVATDTGFENTIITPTRIDRLPVTAWQGDTALEPDTTYYWRVRAHSADSRSAWSAVGAFTTAAVTAPEPEAIADPSTPVSQDLPPIQDEAPLEGVVAGLSASQIRPAKPEPVTVEVVFPDSMQAPTSPIEVSFPGWAIYTLVALLAVIVLLLGTLITLVLRIGRGEGKRAG